uniref:G_PROTEIN_RECEP_F1_2 domain-containing protein n=1 Tax=Meloidogyne hapla TaxID=6305 RepID=A0A1I8BWA1_MELHA
MSNITIDNDLSSWWKIENTFFSTKDGVRLVYGLVDSSVLIFGISLNSLLFYLIQTKTVAIMLPYKKLLLMSCLMDWIVGFWTFIVQPIPCGDHGYRTVLMNGYFRKSSQPIRYAVYLIWIQMMVNFIKLRTRK